MKKIILFDIDYTLSDRSYLKNFGRKYLANLVGQTVAEVNPIVDKIIQESIKCYQVFNIYFYAKCIAKKYQDPKLEQEIIDMFFIYYPYTAAIYPEVKNVLEKLKKENILGIQSDGQEIFQLKKIASIIDDFDKKYIYIFKDKTSEIYEKINSFSKRVVIIDDKPEHIQKLSQRGMLAILIKRGHYGDKYLNNPEKFPEIKKTIDNLNGLIELL